MDMDRQIRVAYTSRKVMIVALVCTICVILTVVSVARNQFSVHGNIYYSYLKQKNMRFHPANDRLISAVHRSSSVVNSKGQSTLITSFRPANLLSENRDPALRAELPPAPAPTSIRSPKCDNVSCGTVRIPYPFGLSRECARSYKYELNCTDSNNSLAQENGLEYPSGPWPFLSTMSGPFQVTNITSKYLIINTTQIKAMPTTPAQGLKCTDLGKASLLLDPKHPYMISAANVFFVTGCHSTGRYSPNPLTSIYDYDLSGGIVSGGICGQIPCTSQNVTSYCNEYACCTLSVNASWEIYMMSETPYYYPEQRDYCPFCSIVFPASYSTWDKTLLGVGQYGVQLLWAIQDYDNCSAASSQPDYACFDNKSRVICSDVTELPGYICECSPGYQGDGYENGIGCKDVNECLDASLNQCSEHADCINLQGTYKCLCHNGRHGQDGYSNGTGCTHQISTAVLISGIASGIGIFITINVVIVWCLWRRWKNRLGGSCENLQLSTINFHETLMELQKRDGANVCKIFSLEELKKATNNFSQDHELGSGGFGTVFQGVLEDYMRVAIKRPKNEVGESQNDIKQFINEVTILSQVNHRNLVKLLGCCLETRVPLLVYEYVLNGNLLEHLQGQKRIECKSSLVLDWDKRLDIAIGIAEALRYLHFGTSPPIYHRDVKCSNILLDDKYQAKVADFGISRLIPIESTHFSTMIQGTPGYLDPEFFENMQISDKSDVYSFGVVLLELITAEKPIDLSREHGNQNLVFHASRLIKEARLEDITDEVLNASSNPEMLQDIYKVAQVALKCVKRHREHRPSMKDVLDELLLIKKTHKVVSDTLSFESSKKDWVSLRAHMDDSSGGDFESLEKDWVPLRAHMVDSSQFTSFHGGNTSTYSHASISNIELFPR
ncbi:hypothetical protein O6H91_10G008400 [Diphasiastrum complanatum]|uniref:Uncharacterized protein n=1 Tax=Diphasiastrum complanatum TaxID=34168 RepID=A0ACC2CE56_DIPCM|nr:hypothetical protein O6H91_10G008400 [Diphasiastrum complanatum]